MFIMATGNTVWVILTEGDRIRIKHTGVIVPSAAWNECPYNIVWVPIAKEIMTFQGL